MLLSDLKQYTNIALLGRGLEGKSTYAFLRDQGVTPEQITILDKKTQLELPAGVKSTLGNEYMDQLEEFDCIWKAPGITSTIVEQTTGKAARSFSFISQTEFFLMNYTGKIIGITGTKGKSTISTLTYLMLQNAGVSVVLAGNVGKPVLDLIDWKNPPAYVVYEFSSFMIESVFTQWTGRKIDIAVCNTLYNTHTAEHGGYKPYIEAKLLLFRHAIHCLLGTQAQHILQGEFPHIVLPTQTVVYGTTGTYTRSSGGFFIDGKFIFSDTDVALLGDHNKYNICALLGIADLLNISEDHTQEVVRSFTGLEHRLEYVGKYKNIDRYNDAIATTPQATGAALDSFGDKVDTLFYGGIMGEYDHQIVADKIAQYHIHNLVLFPDTGSLLYDLLDPEIKSSLTIYETRSMEDAVVWAAQHTTPDQVVLLSCGSPSFSVWSGFVEKGTRFKEAVRSLI